MKVNIALVPVRQDYVGRGLNIDHGYELWAKTDMAIPFRSYANANANKKQILPKGNITIWNPIQAISSLLRHSLKTHEKVDDETGGNVV